MRRRRPPEELPAGSPGFTFWVSVSKRFALDLHHLAILRESCLSLNRAESCRLIIDRDGEVIHDRFGQAKPHPALNAERDARQCFAALVRALGLTDEDVGGHEPPSPPRQKGRTR